MRNLLRFVPVYIGVFCFNTIISWLFSSFILSPESWQLDVETTQLIILAISLIFGLLAAIPMTWSIHHMNESDKNSKYIDHKRATVETRRVPRQE
ncbi:MAG: hypothetical protein IT324_07160 [Anaerolineae bacterium]|nr:hypothetical protein [Anaerolineae bacterium]